MTLLPTATHIDIAAAMALWILGWHILWGLPPKYDNESNGNLDDNATLAANVFYASTLNVILQRHTQQAEAVWIIHDFVAHGNAY